MVKLTALVVSLVWLLSGGAGGALAVPADVKPADVAATRTYLRAYHGLLRAEAREAPSEKAAVHGLIASVRGQCANVLAGAPASKVVEDLRVQMLDQVSGAESGPTRGAQIAFAKKVERLRWSNRKLTYYAHGAAEETRANAELVIPDICSEAKAIVADGYQTVPAEMARYERQELAANSKVTIVVRPHEKGAGGLHEMILLMLKPYERPNERALIPPQPSTHQIEMALKVFFSYAIELVGALGLPVTPPE
jgi:hypothetical protein